MFELHLIATLPIPEWLTLDRVLVSIGALLLWRQLRQTNRQHFRETRREARKNAVELSRLDRPGLREARNFVVQHFPDIRSGKNENVVPYTLDELRERGFAFQGDLPDESRHSAEDDSSPLMPRNEKNNDRTLGLELSAAMNYLEHIALLVFSQTTDEDMAFDINGTTVVIWGHRFREYINECQKRNSRLYEYLPFLVERWWARLAEQGLWPRQPPPREHWVKPYRKPLFVIELESRERYRRGDLETGIASTLRRWWIKLLKLESGVET